MKPHTHCHFCGTLHTSSEWPRVCGACGQTTYRNPVPVAVALIPVKPEMPTRPQIELLVVKRAIKPSVGEMAFPGGFVNFGETIEQATAREVEEEAGIELEPRLFRVFGVDNSTNGNLLIFCTYVGPSVAWSLLTNSFRPNREVSEIGTVGSGAMLAFPTHNRMLARYFERPTWH